MTAYSAMEALFSRMIHLERTGGGPSTLRAMRQALRNLGNPHLLLPLVVNVVGTKGKGSTAFHLSALLEAQGLRVGLFTSPHLRGYHERVRINRAPVAPEVLGSFVLELHRFLEKRGGFRSVFELLTLAAIQIFLDAGVDVAIFEAGLGGRLDATAVFHQDLTVLTSIGHDHADILGHALPMILREKLGILQPRQGELVAGPQRPFLLPLVRKLATFYRVPLYEVGRDLRIRRVTPSLEGTRIVVEGLLSGEYTTDQVGYHQGENLALALLASYVLTGNLPPARIITEEEGRFQVIRYGDRWLVLDGAHNAMSLQALRETLETFFPSPWTCVLGMQRDKLTPPVRRELARWPAVFWATSPGPPRGLSPGALIRGLPELVWQGEGSLDAVLHEAIAATPSGGVVVITGSLHLVGELLATLTASEKGKFLDRSSSKL